MAGSSHNWIGATTFGRYKFAIVKCLFVAVALLATACQQGHGEIGGTQAAITAEYANDIRKICDAVKLSGADKDPGGQVVIVANYLAAHLETKESRDWMIKIQPLEGDAKARAFDEEARRVGLPVCAVSAMWKGSTRGGPSD